VKKLALVVAILLTSVAEAEIKRTPSGKPDLSGVYDTGTLTPEQRPEFLGEIKYLYPWVADLLNWAAQTAYEWFQEDTSDADRGAPPAGGDGNNTAGAGGVGGYNAFYIDIGKTASQIDGKVPTSILYDPPNGRRPPTLEGVSARLGDIYQSFIHENTGTATWLDKEGPGPFDGPESLAPSERCLISFAATVPTLPSLYNNYKRIIQTEDHLMILQEMVHDARIIRIDGEHSDPNNRSWLGDSIGRWEGDTLVVNTKNFKGISGLGGADENLEVEERFSIAEDGNLLYDFTVVDDTVWEAPWSGQYIWTKSQSKVYEYACHEGNYAMGNILRGARLLEREWRAAEAAQEAGQAAGGR
tara:strand:+ start:28 stop:1098 length:1071 start_codon:yes stop_codon:yes gene_type:complete